jgi:hypothetical protein
MIKYSLIVFSLCLTNLLTSQNTIKYTYDKSGNLTQRYIKVMNLRLDLKPSAPDSVLGFKVYPNPSDEYITMSGALPNNSTMATIYIYNIEGRLVKKDTYYATEKKIHVTDLVSGIYFLTVKYSETKESSYKLIIQH